jgi:hypothetical protein
MVQASGVQTIGVDLGSQKCMLVADDADIVLTDTGSISRPTLVSFFGKSRLVGEEAAPQVLPIFVQISSLTCSTCCSTVEF